MIKELIKDIMSKEKPSYMKRFQELNIERGIELIKLRNKIKEENVCVKTV